MKIMFFAGKQAISFDSNRLCIVSCGHDWMGEPSCMLWYCSWADWPIYRTVQLVSFHSHNGNSASIVRLFSKTLYCLLFSQSVTGCVVVSSHLRARAGSYQLLTDLWFPHCNTGWLLVLKIICVMCIWPVQVFIVSCLHYVIYCMWKRMLGWMRDCLGSQAFNQNTQVVQPCVAVNNIKRFAHKEI